MNRVIINLEALNHNFQLVNKWIKRHGGTWTLVSKVLCGHSDTLKALQQLGVQSMGDSRLANIRAIERLIPEFEAWYLRLPHVSVLKDVVSLTDVSLNSEVSVIEGLNEEAKKQDKVHRIIIMIELGDLREGVLPGSLLKFYDHVFQLSNIEVMGIGANLACLSGTVPNIDQLTQLILYRELLELKFNRKLPMISAGSSVVLPLLLEGKMPKAMNHFRIGEAVFLGTDLVNGGKLKGLRDDAVLLEAEIAEIKEKSLIPMGETTARTPFDAISEDEKTPGQRGYRALVTVGQLDTEVSGLTPMEPNYRIAGASSDLIVVNIGDEADGLTIGDSIRFKLNYGALLRLMAGKYLDKVVKPKIGEFILNHEDDGLVVPPVLDQVGSTIPD
ncbi:MAG: alanine/ornithine racemase family PLP-dependent enzyme [Calditrichaeota bacterium]|nr:alanine/ornithine racemase family PLP-dependent enzyme [Calditrichota bacterium]MBT7789668.1 alanine/ornithine racemase family PLP-dependent enzyme [Calditrichota bacterium]